jgi:hypothetical protein
MTEPPDLPFVDEYAVDVAAAADRTWAAVHDYATRLSSTPHALLGRLLGTVPRSGFEVVGSDPPQEIVLGGRHRFSTYRLVFRVDPHGGRTRVRAVTYAVFPGLHGWAYRTGLILSTGHRRATQGMLRRIADRAEA